MSKHRLEISIEYNIAYGFREMIDDIIKENHDDLGHINYLERESHDSNGRYGILQRRALLEGREHRLHNLKKLIEGIVDKIHEQETKAI